MRDAAKVKPRRLYEEMSARGTRYFMGRLGAARILMFQGRETADDGGAVWDLFVEAVDDTQPRPSQGERSVRRAPGCKPWWLQRTSSRS
jgi:hypothetical protein